MKSNLELAIPRLFLSRRCEAKLHDAHRSRASMMKGVGKGLAELEFIISVFVFITTISFVTFIIINNIPILHAASASDSLKSRSYQYSELLMFDEGAPKNWNQDPEAAERIGFSTDLSGDGKRHLLDRNKIEALRTLCLDYQLARQKLGLEDYDIVVDVSYLNGDPVSGLSTIVCGPAVTTQLRPQFQTVRLGVLQPDNHIVRVKVVIIGD